MNKGATRTPRHTTKDTEGVNRVSTILGRASQLRGPGCQTRNHRMMLLITPPKHVITTIIQLSFDGVRDYHARVHVRSSETIKAGAPSADQPPKIVIEVHCLTDIPVSFLSDDQQLSS